jgi:hypothetical protein
MTGPAPLAFPGSRTLAGWWRQLTPWQPRALWVGHLLLHHVEALARLTQLASPDPLHRLVLKALALTPGETLEQLDARLHLGRPLLGQVLRALQTEALAEAASGWSPTPLGRRALENGAYPRPVHQRRTFAFVEGERSDQPAQYLQVDSTDCLPWSAGEEWRFEVQRLHDCVARPDGWKKRRHFPLDVQQVEVEPAPTAAGPAEWQCVVLDRPERLAAVVVRTEDDRLLGFGVRQENWALQSTAAAFALDTDWQEVFPQLAEAQPLESWDQAWRAWCQPRGLTGAAVETSSVQQPEGHRLLVTVPARLMERLRATRSDALKGEAWVLAGTGRLRPAALLEIVEAEGTLAAQHE